MDFSTKNATSPRSGRPHCDHAPRGSSIASRAARSIHPAAAEVVGSRQAPERLEGSRRGRPTEGRLPEAPAVGLTAAFPEEVRVYGRAVCAYGFTVENAYIVSVMNGRLLPRVHALRERQRHAERRRPQRGDPRSGPARCHPRAKVFRTEAFTPAGCRPLTFFTGLPGEGAMWRRRRVAITEVSDGGPVGSVSSFEVER